MQKLSELNRVNSVTLIGSLVLLFTPDNKKWEHLHLIMNLIILQYRWTFHLLKWHQTNCLQLNKSFNQSQYSGRSLKRLKYNVPFNERPLICHLTTSVWQKPNEDFDIFAHYGDTENENA